MQWTMGPAHGDFKPKPAGPVADDDQAPFWAADKD
jgi:hypothetical protein